MKETIEQNIVSSEVKTNDFSMEINQTNEELAKKEILNYLLDEESEFEV